MEWLKRAWSDTREQLGGISGIFLLGAGPILGVAAHYQIFGRSEMIAELHPAISALAGLGLAAILIFLWNLSAAPYRVERDRAVTADQRTSENERAIADLKSQMDDLRDRKARLEVEFAQVMHGAHPDDAVLSVICAFIYIKNVGELPSSALDWGFECQLDSGEITNLAPHVFENITFHGFKVGHADAIYEKTLSPVPGGGMTTGYLFALTSSTEYNRTLRVRAACSQVDGKQARSKWQALNRNPDNKGAPQYYPGMGLPSDWESASGDDR